MVTNFDIDSYLPDQLKGEYRVKSVDLLKVGYMGLRRTRSPSVETDSAAERQCEIERFVSALYEVFGKSPNVLEIRPSRKDNEKIRAGARYGRDRISLLGCVQLRVALSEQQRREYGRLTEAPEQFNLLFDGGLYFTWVPVERIPAFSSVGQAAREFLKASVLNAGPLELAPLGAPTPIHPDIYFVGVEPLERASLADRRLIPIPKDEDLIVLYSAETTVSTAVQYLRTESLFALNSFYDARIKSRAIDEQLRTIAGLNEQLSGLLAELFEHTAIVGVLRRTPRKIRHLLSRLHLYFQELSNLESQLNAAVDEMNNSLEQNLFLEPLSPYLNSHASEHESIDKDTQLRLMDYAGSEAVNVGVVQATIWASVIGALVGSIMTLLIK